MEPSGSSVVSRLLALKNESPPPLTALVSAPACAAPKVSATPNATPDAAFAGAGLRRSLRRGVSSNVSANKAAVPPHAAGLELNKNMRGILKMNDPGTNVRISAALKIQRAGLGVRCPNA